MPRFAVQRYNRRSIVPYARMAMRAGRAVGTMARQWKTRNTRNNTKQSSKSLANTAPITAEHDTRQMYRRKRMPKGKRKNWVSFAKKVKAVMISQLGLTSALIRRYSYIYAAASTQTWTAVHMYPLAGSSGTFGTAGSTTGVGKADHIEDIYANDTTVNNGRATFQSCTQEIQITNRAVTPCVIDCYYYYTRKALPRADVFETVYANGFIDQTASGVAGEVVASSLGATPFQNPDFCSHFKITKIRRILLPGSATTSFQRRDPKNHTIRASDMDNYSHLPRHTTGVLFIAYGQPDGGATDGASYPANLLLTTNTKYNYYVMENNANRSALL